MKDILFKALPFIQERKEIKGRNGHENRIGIGTG